MALILDYIRLFAPYALLLLGIVSEAIALRREDRLFGMLFALATPPLLIGGAYWLGRRGVS